MENNASLAAFTDEGLLAEYERALIDYGIQISAHGQMSDDQRKDVGRLGVEVLDRLTAVSAKEAEAVARALFNLAEEEYRAFLAFHTVTAFSEYKFEGLLKERFIKQAAAAITAMGKRVKAGA